MALAIASPSALMTTADEINAAHIEAEKHIKTAVANAIRCGELLLKAKAELPHGEWHGWIEENVKFSLRTAQGYMRLAGLNQQRATRVAHLSLRQALKEIGERGPKQQRLERQVDVESLLPRASNVAQLRAVQRQPEVIDVEPESTPQTTSIQASTEKPPVLGPPRVGMQYARMAILDLEQIRADDAERAQAFNHLSRWQLQHVGDADLLHLAHLALEQVQNRGINASQRNGPVEYTCMQTCARILKRWARKYGESQ